ncbi:GntR family transcriptional regulator [Streptomyces camponoticapitis]|uniref:GntR family transcriptional regulator n=1 Tax=Streptomyces camponoticapitis TaxID=1616125 RepID=A0ABQ2EP35_9ACTN|nr:GntR family transcriptional regulator [Streptomyces camponoticapitis]GGK18794.1 GntR family transcriptional regulator [Streptomyces camponoticapitis]
MEGDRSESGEGWEFQRIADVLRAEIGDGIYPVGGYLPPQMQLAEQFDVSRDTIQRALRVLIADGVIESKQGIGSKVLRQQAEDRQQVHTSSALRTSAGRPALGPFIAAAFEAKDVTLDVATLTSESLDTHIRLQAERVRGGLIHPESISVRMLLPTQGVTLAYPRLKDKNNTEDARPLDRLRRITERHTDSLRAALEDLRTEKLVNQVDVEVRTVPFTPTFKLYLLNKTQALHGLYLLVERAMRLDDGEEVNALDVLGLGATLFHYAKDQDLESQGSLFVDSAQTWFNKHWAMLGEESPV